MIPELQGENSNHIRKMDLRHDLNQIADLIEMSFPIHKDPDGQIYIQKMRKAAREMNLLGWLSPWAEVANVTASGFVWEEDDRIVGNLSLIPFEKDGRRVYMIANVAVHPAYRRKGIARALTRRAVGYLRRRNTGEVWLQVREDNMEAQELYRSVGFRNCAVRTTWRIKPGEVVKKSSLEDSKKYLRLRRNSDWKGQTIYLDQAYPPDLRWNYPLELSRLAPGGFQYVANLLEGIQLRQWTVDCGLKGSGQLAWQKTEGYANNLWLAFDESQEVDLLPVGLLGVFQRLSPIHPISIDYPQGRAVKVLEGLGFRQFRTLIWMACRL